MRIRNSYRQQLASSREKVHAPGEVRSEAARNDYCGQRPEDMGNFDNAISEGQVSGAVNMGDVNRYPFELVTGL